MSDNNVAILSSIPGYILFTCKGRTIKFCCSKAMERILRVKEWKDGCATVDAKFSYSDEPIEEYVDVAYPLGMLYMDAKEFLSGIEKVEVRYD